MIELDFKDATTEKLTRKLKSGKAGHSHDSAYLKLVIGQDQFLVKLSDVLAVKYTNLITALPPKVGREHRIYGSFYYQHEIIPIYKIKIRSTPQGVVVNVDLNNKQELSLHKYHYLFILQRDSLCGLMVSDLKNTEIINFHPSPNDNASRNIHIIDLQKILGNINP